MDDIVSSSSTYRNTLRHHKLYGETIRRICRIEVYQGSGYELGTGILVAQDVVLTCYHVLRSVIEKEISPQNVIFRFEYQMEKDSPMATRGKEFFLRSGDWLIHPISTSSSEQEYKEDCELDCALVRIVDYTGAPPDRGYASLPKSVYPFTEKSRITIFQHPNGKPLAESEGDFLGIDKNGCMSRSV